MSSNEPKGLFLELGDIIKIIAPDNSDINDKNFYINYLDKTRISILDINNKENINLNLTDGEFNDKSIESIELISRSEEIGYARQNDLIPGKWITISFGGDIPAIINGEITDLTRLDKVIPTLKMLLARNSKILLISHLGRPKGKFDENLSLKIILPHLEKKIRKKSFFC